LNFRFEPDDIEILQGIVEESSEHLKGIEEGILKLEADFDKEILDSVFRALHSVKGVAGFVDFAPIKDTAHSLESMLTDMRKELYTSTADTTDALLRGIDILNYLVVQLRDCMAEFQGNPPSEAFDLSIDEAGFASFIEEVSALRSRLVTVGDGAGATAIENEPTSAEQLPASQLQADLKAMLPQMTADFIEETVEHLSVIEENCVAWEKDADDPEVLNSILRGFHSIKGGAGVIASMREQEIPGDPVVAIKLLTHATESLLQAHRSQSARPSGQIIDLVLTAVDKVATLTELVRANREADFSIDDMVARMQTLSAEITQQQADQDMLEESGSGSHQLVAFLDIAEHSFEAMKHILEVSARDGGLEVKKVKQYLRILHNLISAATYLGYEDTRNNIVRQIGQLSQHLNNGKTSLKKLRGYLEKGYQEILENMEPRLAQVRQNLSNIPTDYAEKKLGEILVSQHKITHHDLENALKKQRKIGEILVDSGVVKPVDIAVATAQQVLAREREADAVPVSRAPVETANQSIRVSQEKLDRLTNMIGELIISKNRIQHLANRIATDYELTQLAREAKTASAEVARISDELQDAIMSARMIPLKVLFQRYPRTIRDMAKRAEKQVELSIEGEETELDKNVIEALNDPLVHMLRNAVDHGIEAPEVRRSLGKNGKGNIRLQARYQGGNVIIELTDDGSGLDAQKIIAKALQKGLISHEQAGFMSPEEAYQLIFMPGFSTRETVTELSGRGVGMDVVKTNIEKVGGSVAISSKPRQGTTFTVKIPLSMSVMKGLMVESGGQKFILPLESIEETVKLSSESLRRYQHNLMANVREEILPLFSLREILALPVREQDRPAGRVPVVVMSYEGYKFGVIVDRFQKEQEFVIKALNEELAALKIYAGATILGDGSVVLILNPAQLLYAPPMKTEGKEQ
jgi:two-component system chemotaxis sensor kinase CheA